MNLDQAPIPNGVEAPFILITEANKCNCDYCRSNNTVLRFRGALSDYYYCTECNLPFSILRK